MGGAAGEAKVAEEASDPFRFSGIALKFTAKLKHIKKITWTQVHCLVARHEFPASAARPTRGGSLGIAALWRLPRAGAGVGFTVAKDLACPSFSLPLLLWRGRASLRGASCTT